MNTWYTIVVFQSSNLWIVYHFLINSSKVDSIIETQHECFIRQPNTDSQCHLSLAQRLIYVCLYLLFQMIQKWFRGHPISCTHNMSVPLKWTPRHSTWFVWVLLFVRHLYCSQLRHDYIAPMLKCLMYLENKGIRKMHMEYVKVLY